MKHKLAYATAFILLAAIVTTLYATAQEACTITNNSLHVIGTVRVTTGSGYQDVYVGGSGSYPANPTGTIVYDVPHI